MSRVHNLKIMEFEIEPCDKCTKNDLNLSVVPVLNINLSYDEFFKKYMHQNLPCIVQNVTQTWEAHSKWLKGNKPNLEYLKNRYGSCQVTIYDCNERYFNSHKTETCQLDTFLDTFWGADSPKYLKDWHLKNTFKNDSFYEVPIYFASDWLNEFLTEKSEDDYRFVYMGQAGTWTPFHCDVFNSFSWSANVCGSKRWILFPPGQEDSLRDSLGNLPFDIQYGYKDTTHFELIQNPGEAIFVPSGWYHQVWNLEDTISINHNWVNGCNIDNMWRAIDDNLKSVKKEIDDCKNMEGFLEHCQIMLNASFGMDFYRFYDFIEFIASKRLRILEKCESGVLFHGHILGYNHAIFDLKAVKFVLEKFLQHSDVFDLFKSRYKNPKALLQQITKFVEVS